jgi:hypothetical protein
MFSKVKTSILVYQKVSALFSDILPSFHSAQTEQKVLIYNIRTETRRNPLTASKPKGLLGAFFSMSHALWIILRT